MLQYLSVNVVKISLVQRDSEQDENNALCRRKNMNAAFSCAILKIGFIDGLAIFQDGIPAILL